MGTRSHRLNRAFPSCVRHNPVIVSLIFIQAAQILAIIILRGLHAMKAVRAESSYDGGTQRMTRRIGRFAVLLCVLLNPVSPFPVYAFDSCVPQPTSSSYFVATNGDDSNPGTQSQPFRTLQKAQSKRSSKKIRSQVMCSYSVVGAAI
jgi:hypothetical protein